jgi:hypothetical protein
MKTTAITEDAGRASSCTSPSRCSHDLISIRDAWSRVLGLATWADMIRTHMDHQAKLRQLSANNAVRVGGTPYPPRAGSPLDSGR